MKSISIKYPDDYLKESTATLKIHPDTKRLWLVLLDLFARFDFVCKKYNIRYSLVAGSLIGAFRHKGFIPWDDDMDVMMVRSEYEKLVSVASAEFVSPYFFQTNDSDPDSARGHAQLRNSTTTGILKLEMTDGKCDWRFNQGIFIDIFPLDNIPDGEQERMTFYGKASALKANMERWRYVKWLLNHKNHWGPGVLKMLPRFVLYFVIEKVLKKNVVTLAYRKYECFVQKYNALDTECCASVMFHPTPNRREGVFRNADLKSTHYVPFEFLTAQVSDMSEQILVDAYGDWHRHVITANTHGGMIVDTEKSYTEYFVK